MSKKTIKRIQRIMRGIGVLGLCAFMWGCVFYMGRLCPITHITVWAGVGCFAMWMGVTFGGVLGGLLR